MKNQPVKLLKKRIQDQSERLELLRRRSIAGGRGESITRQYHQIKDELEFLNFLLGQVSYLKKDRDEVRAEINTMKSGKKKGV